jgi:CheY-like chemotaxis protein
MSEKNFSVHAIMLAEDDDDDKFIFSDVLRTLDPSMQLEYVANGVQLMELLRHFVPDLLFLDLEMPYKNGLECLLEIRNNPVLSHLPVVVFSSTTRPANIQTAYEMGAHLFLIKSSLSGEYTTALHTILQLDWSNPDVIKEQYCINGRWAAFG